MCVAQSYTNNIGVAKEFTQPNASYTNTFFLNTNKERDTI